MTNRTRILFLLAAVLAAQPALAGRNHGGKSDGCGCSHSRPSPSPAPAPTPAPSPAPSPRPSPAPAPSPSPSPAPSPAPTSRSTAYTSSGTWFTGSGTTGHPLTWQTPVPAAPASAPEPVVIVVPTVVKETLVREVYVFERETAAPPAPAPAAVRETEVILRSPVFFPLDKWDLSEHGRNTIELLVHRALRTPNAEILVADGHASPDGPPSRNAFLALRRVEAVVAQLVVYGFPRERIRMGSHGDTKPEVPNTLGRRKLNRRVDIELRGLKD